MPPQEEAEYAQMLEQAIQKVVFDVTNQYTARRNAINANQVIYREEELANKELTREEHECNGLSCLARIVLYGFTSTLKVSRKEIEDWAFYKEKKKTLRELLNSDRI